MRAGLVDAELFSACAEMILYAATGGERVFPVLRMRGDDPKQEALGKDGEGCSPHARR